MEFPKWIKPHESHDISLLEKTHEVHRDRVAGISVLVHDAEKESELLAPHEAPEEPHEVDHEHQDEA